MCAISSSLPPGAEPEGNHESEALRWVTEDELVDFDVDDGLRRMAKAGFAAARALYRSES